MEENELSSAGVGIRAIDFLEDHAPGVEAISGRRQDRRRPEAPEDRGDRMDRMDRVDRNDPFERADRRPP